MLLVDLGCVYFEKLYCFLCLNEYNLIFNLKIREKIKCLCRVLKYIGIVYFDMYVIKFFFLYFGFEYDFYFFLCNNYEL